MRYFLLFLLFFLLPSAALAESSKLQIVTTTGMIADIVRNIVLDKATVENLIGEGVDPHLYKPVRSDIQKLLRANIVFYNGLLLEGKFTDTFTKLKASKKHVFAVGESIQDYPLLSPKEFKGNFDPHIWMDPKAWEQVTAFIAQTLSTLDQKNAAFYQKNAEAYLINLKELQQYAEKIVSTVPKESRALITAHDAFHYFGRRFDFDVRGIQGISTESEAGIRDVELLVQEIVARNIKAVFVESTVSDRNVKALIAGANAAGHTVSIGGNLFSDAMGKPGTYEGTYTGMIDHNLTTIVRALGGDAPESGMNGKLSPGQR